MHMETPLAERHRAAAAELATYFGVLLPAQFRDPLAEYRTARETVALVDTNFRAIFSLTGPDRVRYLNAVLTSNVRDLAPGGGTLGLLLNSQGHILAELETLAFADRLVILGHQFVGARTAEVLEKFIIMDDAVFADETQRTGTLALEGPAAPEIVRDLAGVDLSNLADRAHTEAVVHTAAGALPCVLIHHSLCGLPGAEFLVRRDAVHALWELLATAVQARGGDPIGYRAIEMLRLEAGVPWFGTDFDERQIPHEAALEESHISYIKGCYTGQEIVERVRSRGHVNRRRIGLRFAAAEPPPPGAAITSAGTEAGSVTSAAFSPQLGCAIGMGYVRRENMQAGALKCNGGPAEIIALPLGVAANAKT
jgi:folate-binding protein YgfZ